MPYIQSRRAYRQKPPAGVAPDLGHPQLKGIQHLWTFANHGQDYVRDNRLSLYQGATWGVSGKGYVVDIAPTSSPPQLLRGIHIAYADEFTVVISLYVRSAPNAYSYYWNDGAWGDSQSLNILLNDAASNQWLGYRIDTGSHDIQVNPTTIKWVTGWNTLIFRRRANYIDACINTIDNNDTNTSTQSGAFQSADTSPYGEFYVGSRGNADATRDSDILVNHARVYSQYIPDGQALDILKDPWAPFSRPLPIWIPSGAAPPAWSNTMNEISAPGAVNEITNANIQTINEI